MGQILLLPGRPAAAHRLARVWFRCYLLPAACCLAAALLSLAPLSARAQDQAPAATQPALPTDPTSPNTVGPTTDPANPLIPAQPLQPLQPAPDLNPRPSVPAGTAPLRAGTTNDPLAAPAPSPAPPAAAASTNNIGVARRFQYNLGGSVGTTYDDNLFLVPSSKRGDLYFTIQPFVSFGFGGGEGGTGQENYVRFSYSPQVLLYLSRTELNTVQHFLGAAGVYHFSRLTITASEDIQILDSTDVGNPQAGSATAGLGGVTPPTTTTAPASNINLDTNQRTRLNLFNTNLGANYYVSDKVSYDLSGQLAVNDYPTLLSSSTLSGSAFFNYTPTGKTTFGAGGTLGYVFADRPNPDQTYEQGNLRISYTPGSKLSASGSVGLELRQSSDRDGSQLSPVFALSVNYAPFDGTSVSLAGNRQIQTSAVVGGQDYTITGFTLSASQRFFQRFNTRMSVGYSHTDYTSEVSNGTVAGRTPANRSDDYFFVQPSVDFLIHEHLTVGGFYSFRSSNSNLGLQNFNDNQVGLRLSLSY